MLESRESQTVLDDERSNEIGHEGGASGLVFFGMQVEFSFHVHQANQNKSEGVLKFHTHSKCCRSISCCPLKHHLVMAPKENSTCMPKNTKIRVVNGLSVWIIRWFWISTSFFNLFEVLFTLFICKIVLYIYKWILVTNSTLLQKGRLPPRFYSDWTLD
jgi:hypothetical protein